MPNLEQRRRFFGNISGSNQDAGGKEVIKGEERNEQEGAPVAGSVPAVPDVAPVREPGAVLSVGVSPSAPVESIPEPVAGPAPGEDAPGDAVPAEPGQALEEASVPERKPRSRRGAGKGVKGKREAERRIASFSIRVSEPVYVVLNRVKGTLWARGERNPMFSDILMAALRHWLKHNERALYDELRDSGILD